MGSKRERDRQIGRRVVWVSGKIVTANVLEAKCKT